ncbi:hypothetical protein SNEBB_002465 [Seison nebaliae]|nr:hypothetical protein SNEBB_002465 [Seison nebaliae]
MIIATFIPTSATIMSNPNHSSYFPIQLFTHSLDVVDLMGIYYMLTTINVQSERRPLIVGFSWAIADLLLTKFLSLWVGARSQEFDWKYTIISLQSIVLLILYISQSFLLSKYMRQPTVKVYGLLILSLSINFICSYLSQMRMLNFFQQFIFQSISTVIFGLMTVVTVNCKPI